MSQRRNVRWQDLRVARYPGGEISGGEIMRGVMFKRGEMSGSEMSTDGRISKNRPIATLTIRDYAHAI